MTVTLNTQDIGLSVNDAADAILGLTDSPKGTPTEQEELQAETTLDEEVEETETDEGTTDEDDLDEEEDSDEDNDDEDDDEPDEDSDEGEEYYEVTITDNDGDERVLEVTEEELVNGYLRQSDYTKKRQKESEEHRTKLEELDAQISEYQDGLLDFVTETEMKIYDYQQVDWEGLKESDPATFSQLWADALYTEKQYRDAQDKLSGIKEGVAAKVQEQQKAYLAEQAELVKVLLPEWDSVKGSIHSYLINEGFDETEVGSIANAKIAVLADKARKFDELSAKRENVSKKKLSKSVPKMVRSGSPTSSGSGKAKATQRAQAQLNKSGSIDDAVALLLSRSS